MRYILSRVLGRELVLGNPLRRLVQERTWDRWAEGHHHLFMQLLEAHGIETPKPALGFRFGMMGELDVPLGIDAGPLEDAVDEASRHLFWGRYGEARKTLQAALPGYPFVEKLIETIPEEKSSRKGVNSRVR